MEPAMLARSITLFVVAGLMEIGGGYLVWLWLRDNRGFVFGALGGLLLLLYGIVPTFQPAHFGRVYAHTVGSSSFYLSFGDGGSTVGGQMQPTRSARSCAWSASP